MGRKKSKKKSKKFFANIFFLIFSDQPLPPIGQLIENMENRMRNGLSEIYFSKTKDIINSCRSVNTLANDQHKREIAQDIHKRLADKQKTDF